MKDGHDGALRSVGATRSTSLVLSLEIPHFLFAFSLTCDGTGRNGWEGDDGMRDEKRRDNGESWVCSTIRILI
jgi:hypothetical protein